MGECCENCLHCAVLKLYQRVPVRLPKESDVVTKIGIDTSKTEFENSLCCLARSTYGIVEETEANNICELFEEEKRLKMKDKDIKVFISLGMSGRKDEDVQADLDRAYRIIKTELFPHVKNVECIDNWSCVAPEGSGNLYYLGEAIKQLDECEYIFFCKDWEKSRGCRIEHKVAKEYNKNIIYENDKV